MSPELALGLAGVFVTTGALVGWAAAAWLTTHSPEQLRLKHALAGLAGTPQAPAPLAITQDPLLTRLSKIVLKSPQDMSRLQRRLTRAGVREGSAAIYFSLLQLALAAGAAVATLAFVHLPNRLILALAAAAAGYILPSLVLSHRIARRQRAIDNALPDALDLITLCVEAGYGLDQAIEKTALELALAHPALAFELRLVTTEMRAGKPRIEAFHNFSERVGLEEVAVLTAMLTQTDRFGTSIAQALKIQAETARTRRAQMAEERAGRISVKLVFPLALCLLPALFVVVFGPVAIKLYREFFAG